MEDLLDNIIKKYHQETAVLNFLPENRYNKKIFPSMGQYDWFSGQLLYCIIRHKKPKKIIEISTCSGYATLFMAMAIKRNGFGKVYTFEINPSSAKAAQKNFKDFGVSNEVVLMIGDARKMIHKVKDWRSSDIQFLDSEHTEEFASWFIEELVQKCTNKNALFHMHDIMPVSARVRNYGGPPWHPGTLHYYRRLLWRLYNYCLGNKIGLEGAKLNIKKTGKRMVYDGNEGSESIFGNKLAALMPEGQYVFCYDIADKYKSILGSRKFDRYARGHENASGRPMEWNNSLWAYSSAVGEAFKKLKNICH